MSAIGHVHDWGPEVTVDFCHFYEVRQNCAGCHGVLVETVTRNFDTDPMQVAFADPYCDGCRELLDGCEPVSWQA